MTTADFSATFLARSRHFLRTEYPTKLRAAVESLPDNALWWRANDRSNSVGNLLLHLAGNVRQWIVAGVGNTPSTRDRAGEFAAKEGATARELLANLDRTLDEADAVLARLTDSDLGATCSIQGRELTVLEAVYHVVEHFSLHLGQIVFIAKMHTPGAVQFYEDAGGLAHPIWPKLVQGSPK